MSVDEQLLYDAERTKKEMAANLKSFIFPLKKTSSEKIVAAKEYDDRMAVITQNFKNYLVSEYANDFTQETQDLLFVTAWSHEQDSTIKAASMYKELAELLRKSMKLELPALKP